ncbi:SWIM zinc finger family protein [Roseivirga sp.]|uniref:SWIM zinc finger family protein n=1 Tax=Roseivirga sp. TaxID=1964215 RepID=UPI002B264E7B|nr:SWIM zinc finger family protein [Roseivirga sp.]
MSEVLTYSYRYSSELRKGAKEDELFMSQYSEVQKGNQSCFFWGKLTEPYTLSRCLITLNNIVQSSFNLSPFERSLMKDPIVTAGNDTIRFEGFSHCAGVYARVDVLPGGHDGEFLENGTTNVDFNQPMINALSGLRKADNVVLSVGQKSVGLHQKGGSVVERKVPLPVKWIKGLTTVQIYMAQAEQAYVLSKMQCLHLFRTLPKGTVKTDYYLVERGGKFLFSPVKSNSAILIGGVHRLRLLEPLIPLLDQMKVYPHKEMQSTTWQLYFGNLVFSFSISRDHWRGFSGEGAALESLIEDVPEDFIEAMEKFSYANQSFNATLFSVDHGIDLNKVDNLTSRLSAMGLLGFDLDGNEFFYRRLPYKLNRILSLNPRLKEAIKLLENNKVEIVSNDGSRVEAKVVGTGVHHVVIIEEASARCTCTWYAQNQGERGPCKHILAVKKKTL